MKKVICTIFVIVGLTGFLLFSQEQKTEKSWKTIGPELKDVGDFWCAYMYFKGPYSTIGEKFNVFREEFKKQGLKAIGAPIVLYWNPPKVSPEDRLVWAVCVRVAEDANVQPPLLKTKFKKKKAAVCVHVGDINEIVKSNDILDKFIDDNWYISDWPVYEVFYKDRVEIVHPVKKIKDWDK